MAKKWIQWIKTAHKGLRYYEHDTRRHGKKKDRYYAIRFKVDNKLYEYGIGWWSEGNPEEARRKIQIWAGRICPFSDEAIQGKCQGWIRADITKR